MIYVIHATGTRFVKIGVAKNPVQRMRLFQTGQPTKLVILALADWPNSQERRIHRVLIGQRVEGEWFVINEHIDSLINHMRSGADSPGEWLSTFAVPSRLSKILSIAR